MDVPIRKRLAGADSFGNIWPEDGAVVAVPYEQALVLLAVPDGGFSESHEAAPASGITEPDADSDLSEVDPADENASDVPAKRPYRRRTQT